FLFFIFILILYFEIKYCFDYTIEVYLIAYSILRFCMEFLRYDNARGFFLFFSTSQWISIFMFLFSFIIIFLRKTKSRKIKL
ncbi:MAG: prolipoprotein diacylglyceryl transferase, partial [Clostridia bacterium]|nr:prolipoprotein diacylglyceryl transferase [Clostridia bacterium]